MDWDVRQSNGNQPVAEAVLQQETTSDLAQ